MPERSDASDRGGHAPEAPERSDVARRVGWAFDMSVPQAAFGLLCGFVAVYCVLEARWEPLAALAFILAAFVVAMEKMVDDFEVGQKGLKGKFRRSSVEAEYEILHAQVETDRLKQLRPGPEPAPEKGSPEG